MSFPDLMLRQGVIDNVPKPPLIMGFESAGVVEVVGENVSGLIVSPERERERERGREGEKGRESVCMHVSVYVCVYMRVFVYVCICMHSLCSSSFSLSLSPS